MLALVLYLAAMADRLKLFPPPASTTAGALVEFPVPLNNTCRLDEYVSRKQPSKKSNVAQSWWIVKNLDSHLDFNQTYPYDPAAPPSHKQDHWISLNVIHPCKWGNIFPSKEPCITNLWVNDSSLAAFYREHSLSRYESDYMTLSKLVLDDTRSPQSAKNNRELHRKIKTLIATHRTLIPHVEIASDPLIAVSQTYIPDDIQEWMPWVYEFWAFQSNCLRSQSAAIPASKLPRRPDFRSYLVLGIGREELGRKVLQSLAEKRKFFLPGNPGETSRFTGVKEIVNTPGLCEDFAKACEAAEKIDGHIWRQ